MRKILLGSILISTSALALGIDINTKIKWNSIVVVAAAHDVGLEAENNTHPEVSSTYYRILGDLLERETFSVADAVSVCNKECKKSQFLKEGRGQSGKKCPEICKSFGNALIEENNKKTDSVDMGPMNNTRGYSPAGRVYDKNKKFYALQDAASVHNLDYDDVEKGRWNKEKCTWKLFEFDTNKQIGVCDNYRESRSHNDLFGSADFKITDQRYKDAKFSLECSAFIGHDLEGTITETVCTLDVKNAPQKTLKYCEPITMSNGEEVKNCKPTGNYIIDGTSRFSDNNDCIYHCQSYANNYNCKIKSVTYAEELPIDGIYEDRDARTGETFRYILKSNHPDCMCNASEEYYKARFSECKLPYHTKITLDYPLGQVEGYIDYNTNTKFIEYTPSKN